MYISFISTRPLTEKLLELLLLLLSPLLLYLVDLVQFCLDGSIGGDELVCLDEVVLGLVLVLQILMSQGTTV